ncbi:hypothetical protein KAX97_12985 [candidate division WOR-3 bacterium]|nr:hypothetical protein [candidate division WOR-3 bacterium]
MALPCGTGRFATVMVHFMNGYGSYEREKKRQEDRETWRQGDTVKRRQGGKGLKVGLGLDDE